LMNAHCFCFPKHETQKTKHKPQNPKPETRTTQFVNLHKRQRYDNFHQFSVLSFRC